MLNKTLFWLKKWQIHLFLLVIAVLLTYGHTLDVPFYLDDFSSIQENPVIYQWQGTLKELWQFAPLRIVGYLSFALNYQVHQFEVAGYHIVNIFIHLLAGFAVFGFISALLKTPALKDTLSPTAVTWLPLVVALFFLLHPLQIQAVTYIVQRLASLAALFYISALFFYIQARVTTNIRISLLYGIGCGIMVGLAFFTKQNTATLPLAFMLIEIVFFHITYKRLALVGGLAVSLLISIWIVMALAFQLNPFSLEAMQALSQAANEEISRQAYFATQFSVLLTYLKLFFFPIGLHIDYEYPITESLLNLKAFWHLFLHLSIISIAVYFIRRFPILSFGILFYYVAHLVESSVIPIRDVIFEHRTYLPNLGLFLACGWALLTYLPHLTGKYITIGVVSCLILILGVLTWQRNQLWRNPINLWQDNVAQSPDKKRAWVILGKHLIQAERPQEGIYALEKSVITKILPDGSQTQTYTIETVLNLIVAYRKLKNYETALNLIEHSLHDTGINPFDRSKFYINQGNIFFDLKQFAKAETAYRQAMDLYPQSLIARANLASLLGATGRIAEAVIMYHEILAIDPNNPTIQENLRILMESQNKPAQ